MIFKPYIIEADQPVKLRFLPLVLDNTDQKKILISLDLILKEGKVYVLIGFPDHTELWVFGRLKDICFSLLKLLRIRFKEIKEAEDFQWYLLNSQGDKVAFYKINLNIVEGHPSSANLIPTDRSHSPFNLTAFDYLDKKEKTLKAQSILEIDPS